MRSTVIGKVRVSLLLLGLAGAGVCPAAHGDDVPGVTSEVVADWFRHNEGLVRSVECQFERIPSVTRKEMEPLIREVCRRNGKESEVVNYLYTEDVARRLAVVVHWWRQGVKERTETYNPYDDPQGLKREVQAFDGQIVRSLARDNDQQLAAIKTLERAEWHAMNRVHPLTFLFRFQETPYADIVAKGGDFRAFRPPAEDGKGALAISVRHPKFTYRTFIFVFDQKNRLIERRLLVQRKADPAPWMWEKHRFTDYRAFKDASGEEIWFPHKALYSYYVGQLPDGTPVEYTTEVITVKDIRFNFAIPDDKFVIDIPKGIPVFDGVTNMGWIGLPDPDPIPHKRFGWWRRLALVILLVQVGVIVFVLRKRRRVARG